MPPKKDQRLENSNEVTSTNFLESLTDDLIHRIMDFLTTVEETSFGILSKRLRSSWLSFPSLDYDFALFSREPSSSNQLAEFFDFVDKSLQLRSPYIKPQLEKLRFKYNGLHPQSLQNGFESIVKKLLEFALENSAKVLEVDISRQSLPLSYRVGSEAFSILLKPVFFLQCVTILKLKGFAFPEPNLDLTCPSVEIFTLDTCNGLKNIRISSACSRLSKTEIRRCFKLENVHVNAEHVESFSYIGTDALGCQLDISACSDSLKDLTLKYATVYEVLQQIDEYVVLKYLNLSNCNLPNTLNIGSFSLRRLKLNNCYNMEKLVVSSENLESFTYHNSWSVTCGIDISECISLTNLELNGADITAGWLRDTISALTLLEMLVLNSCLLLEKIEFKHNKLARLVLKNFDALNRADIDARNLLQFSYSGHLEPFPIVITSSKCNVIISLEGRTYISDRWFRNLSKFLMYFNHCPSLTLICSSAEKLIFPREYLWFSSFPLPDMKHLIVELAKLPESATLAELVETVLWIIPNPETVSIVSSTKRYLLKFHFSNQVSRKENANCCPTRPFKCWRHHVGKIEMENFELEDRKNLEKLLFDGYLG